MLRVPDCIRDGIRFAVPERTEWQRIGDQIDAAFVFAWPHFVKVDFRTWHLANRMRVCYCLQNLFRVEMPKIEAGIFHFRAISSRRRLYDALFFQMPEYHSVARCLRIAE